VCICERPSGYQRKIPNQSTLPPNSRTEAGRRVLKSSGNAKLGSSGKGRVSTQRSSQERLPVLVVSRQDEIGERPASWRVERVAVPSGGCSKASRSGVIVGADGAKLVILNT
jgi:hypothetical protein